MRLTLLLESEAPLLALMFRAGLGLVCGSFEPKGRRKSALQAASSVALRLCLGSLVVAPKLAPTDEDEDCGSDDPGCQDQGGGLNSERDKWRQH